MKGILLANQNMIALIDDEDHERVSQFRWFAHRGRKTWYAEHKTPRLLSKQRTIKLHRFILEISDPNVDVDHKDGNGLNCQRSNLRVCEIVGQNNFNQGIRVDNTSGYKGVSWHPNNRKWMAKICIDGKQKHLGCFDNPAEAAHTYDQAAKELFGEFAWLNFKD